MKKKIVVTEAAVLMALLLPGLWFPGMQAFASGDSQEGVCFYFDRLSGQTREESDASKEEKDRVPGAEGIHWNIGDTVVRTIHGEAYRFRCIDQNYADSQENHRQAALFLCDTVIPADTGAKYVFEELPDGSHGYVYVPGPLADFGDSNEYKYSRVRRWLQEAEGEDPAYSGAVTIHTGVDRAYMGSTGQGMYAQLDAEGLSPSPVGSQKMTDRLFVLSVDEALLYREWLWKFEGAEEENPHTQTGAYCKGYWLRSPLGNGDFHDTGQVYVVDLVHGNLHPAPVCPGTGEDVRDEEISRTWIYGVRPVFVLPQDT